MPDLEPHLAARATADQVRRLHWAIRVLMVSIMLDVVLHAFSVYDRMAVIHPEQERSARERRENRAAINAVGTEVRETKVRLDRLFDRENRLEKSVYDRK